MAGELPEIPFEVPQAGNIFFFTVGGFFACLVTGNIHKYAKLCAQARHETQNYTSHMFVYEGNAFGLHEGSYFPRKDRVRYNGTEGANVNVYTGITRFYRCWLDRLGWDDLRGITDYEDPKQYFTEVATHGYIGINPTSTAVNNYVTGCMNGLSKVSPLAKGLSAIAAVTNYGLFSNMTGLKIALNIGLLLAAVYGIWWVYNKFFGKSKLFNKSKKRKYGIQ